MAPLRTNSLPVQGPYPKLIAPNVLVIEEKEGEQNGNGNGTLSPNVSMEGGALKIDNADGTTTIDFNASLRDALGDEDDKDTFSANIAKRIDDEELNRISTEILEGIAADEESRREWLETRALGISLLGLKLEKPRSDLGAGSAPLEGMSTVRHPLLLEATVSFQATARAELLPAAGPVKIRNDMPIPPKDQLLASTAAFEHHDSLSNKDDLAQALEKDFNHYLTTTATEYVPDTDRMLFYVGFGGDGFKKVYNCPLRRRPVSESVDAEDLIISNAATDIKNCGRVTHRIRMRPSVLKRMQILGVYRDVDLSPPQAAPEQNSVDKKKDDIAGINVQAQRPEDRDYVVYECYCELDLDEFAPQPFKGKGVPLPYRVTLEKQSGIILDIRRNWDEKDSQCMPKQYFVQFPFIRGLGFYGLGYIHLLGNTTVALTASWRLQLDNGMFSNFPGFLYAKGLGRQNTNQIRVAPGSGYGLDIGTQGSIRDAVMPLPYKETGQSFVALTEQINQGGQRLAATANINVGEGKQDAPVGTTLALIEQATKVIDSAHKRLHAAQSEEFQLLKERFREDPEAFWRHNRTPARSWEKEQFLKALESSDLVPVADPNNPTSLHRIAKAMAIKTLQQGSPLLYDPTAVDMRIMRIVGIDPEGLFRPTPAAPPPDPRMEAIQQKAQASQTQAVLQYMEAQIKARVSEMQMLDKEKDRQSRERVAGMKAEVERLRLMQDQIIHAGEFQTEQLRAHSEILMDAARQKEQLNTDRMMTAAKLRAQQVKDLTDLQRTAIRQRGEDAMERERHQSEMERKQREHDMKMEHSQQLHEHKVAAAKAMAKAKPKPKKAKE